MPIWTLAKKELRLLLRDRRAAIILLVLPLIFILVLGLLLRESFGQKSDDRVRVTVLDLDRGPCGLPGHKKWSEVVIADLAETGGIKVETLTSLEEAKHLIDYRKRAAVLVFKPDFSEKTTQCSFLVDGINPFHRDGVYLERIGVELLQDTKQPAQSAVVEQVAQVSLLRVLLPWMIGRAFEKLSEEKFIEMLGNNVKLPLPERFKDLLVKVMKLELDPKTGHARLNDLLRVAAADNPEKMAEYRRKVGQGVKESLSEQFAKYDLTGKTWASLTKAVGPPRQEGAAATPYQSQDGSGLFKRGAQRYQVLVPSYTVMFAFFLVLNVGWVFVSERQRGTLKRLRAAPITRGELLLGKLVPYFLLSLGQGAFLLVAGRLLFGMRWGPEAWSWFHQLLFIAPVVFTTSLAAMGLALLVAAVARTEMQVALYGAVPVLVLALVGGCVLPREMMPEQAQTISLLTPQGWALEAYRELVDVNPTAEPNAAIIFRACGVLSGFGIAFIGMAWGLLRLD